MVQCKALVRCADNRNGRGCTYSYSTCHGSFHSTYIAKETVIDKAWQAVREREEIGLQYYLKVHECNRCNVPNAGSQYPSTLSYLLSTRLPCPSTLPKAIHSPESAKGNNHILITWSVNEMKGRSFGRYHLNVLSHLTFDLTRFLLMTPYCACPSQKYGGSRRKSKKSVLS